VYWESLELLMFATSGAREERVGSGRLSIRSLIVFGETLIMKRRTSEQAELHS
jgi:hypothetical protein